MVQYRRSQEAGGRFFFTVNLQDRSARHLITYIDLLRESIRHVKQCQPFSIIALVILPDHLHMIMRLPEGDNNYPARWKALKSHFSRKLMKMDVGLKRNSKGEINLWQRRYWEHQIRNEHDLQAHVDYIHYNPVKYGYVACVSEWPYSTFHQYVQRELISDDSVVSFENIGFGE